MTRKRLARVVSYEQVEARRLVRLYALDRLGAVASEVRVSSSGAVSFVVGAARYDGFWVRVPVGSEDCYVDLHVCWQLPCRGCGRLL